MFDFIYQALLNYYATMTMVAVCMFMCGMATHALLHRCPEPLTIAGYDDYGYEPVVIQELDSRVYRL